MPQIQHVALLQFKPEVTPEKIKYLFDRLAELQQLITGIIHFSGGKYSSHEGLNKEYTHGFVMTFASVDARDAYLPHPEHEKFKEEIFPCLEDFVIFDYEI
ncbi:MAG: Dabb family protein [Waterburya sp.]